MSERTGVWVCPNCKRTFRGHVFGEGTSMSGPTCNACCVSLVSPSAQEGEEMFAMEAMEEAMEKETRSAEAGYWGY